MKASDLIPKHVEGAPASDREAGDKFEKRSPKAFGALLAKAVDHERKGTEEGARARPPRASGERLEAPSAAESSEPKRGEARASTIEIPGRALPIHESISRAGARATTPRVPQPEALADQSPQVQGEQEPAEGRVHGDAPAEDGIQATRELEEQESARDAGQLVTALGNVAAVIAKIAQPLATSAVAATASGPATIAATAASAQSNAELQTSDSAPSASSDPFPGPDASATRRLPLTGHRRAASGDDRRMESPSGGVSTELLAGMDGPTGLPAELAAQARAAAQASAGMPASQSTNTIASPLASRQGTAATDGAGNQAAQRNAPLGASVDTATAEPSSPMDARSTTATPGGPAGTAVKAQVVFTHSGPGQTQDMQPHATAKRELTTATGEQTKANARLSGAAIASAAAGDGQNAGVAPVASGAAGASASLNAQMNEAVAAQPGAPSALTSPDSTSGTKNDLGGAPAPAPAATTPTIAAQAPGAAEVTSAQQRAAQTSRRGDVSEAEGESPKARGASDPMTRVHGFTRGALVGHAMSAYGGRGHEGSEHDSGSRGARPEDTRDLVREEERTPVESFAQGFEQPSVQHAPQVTAEAPAAPAVLAAPQAPVQTPNELPDFEFAARPPANQPEAASISLHHPDLGPIQLEVHRDRGRVEVHAVIESAHAAAVLRANESGIRQGVQQSGLNFSALRVRMRDDDQQQTRPAPVRRRRTNNQKEA